MKDNSLPLRHHLIAYKYTQNEQYYQVVFTEGQDIF